MILCSLFEASIRLESFTQIEPKKENRAWRCRRGPLPLNSAMELTGMFCVFLEPVGKLGMNLTIKSLPLAYTYKGYATITSIRAESL